MTWGWDGTINPTLGRGLDSGGTEPYFRLFWGWVLPYISRIHTAYIYIYIGEYLHFRYLKCLVMLGWSIEMGKLLLPQ